MSWWRSIFGNRADRIAVPDGLELAAGERPVAVARDNADGTVIATTYRLVAVPADATTPTLARPWHLVDTGAWRPETQVLSVSWVDHEPPSAWELAVAGALPVAFRERVQASVVLVEQVSLGRHRRARVAVRKDLATGDLMVQAVYARGSDPSDQELATAVQEAADRLGEQAGLGDGGGSNSAGR